MLILKDDECVNLDKCVVFAKNSINEDFKIVFNIYETKGVTFHFENEENLNGAFEEIFDSFRENRKICRLSSFK